MDGRSPSLLCSWWTVSTASWRCCWVSPSCLARSLRSTSSSHTTNGRVLTRNLFKHALLVMLWQVTSYHTGCTPTLWARYVYHGALVKVLGCYILVLHSLLAVRTLVLASWTLLLCMLLHVCIMYKDNFGAQWILIYKCWWGAKHLGPRNTKFYIAD